MEQKDKKNQYENLSWNNIIGKRDLMDQFFLR